MTDRAGLAYVFWHWPIHGSDRAAYEDVLARFHKAFRHGDPAGFRRSVSFRVGSLPWSRQTTYEDWYLVDDFAALGQLNKAATTSERRNPHDVVARRAGGGMGGLYGLHSGDPDARLSVAVWISKAPGMSYETFDDVLARAFGRQATIWRRQMVLGPAPEYCVISANLPNLPPELDTAVTVVRDAVF